MGEMHDGRCEWSGFEESTGKESLGNGCNSLTDFLGRWWAERHGNMMNQMRWGDWPLLSCADCISSRAPAGAANGGVETLLVSLGGLRRLAIRGQWRPT